MHSIIGGVDAEAALALHLLKSDICDVGAGCGDATRRGMSLKLQRCALQHAVEAFRARGDFDHRAWSDLAAAIDELLTYRLQFGPGIDDEARSRLRNFVYENGDVFDRQDERVAS